MSKTKGKILYIGLGLIVLNALTFGALMLWPHKTHDSVNGAPALAGATATTTSLTARDGKTHGATPRSVGQGQSERGESSAVPVRDSYTIPISRVTSVLDAMYAYQDASGGDFSFMGKEYSGMGYFVETINGRASDDEKYWILYINNKSSSVGASEAKVKRGDVVEWRYEKSIY